MNSSFCAEYLKAQGVQILDPVPDPDKNCCFCRKAQRHTENGIAVDSAKELYCPVKKCHIGYGHTVKAGTECEDRDTNRDWVIMDHAHKVGQEYQRTGNRRVFLKPIPPVSGDL